MNALHIDLFAPSPTPTAGRSSWLKAVPQMSKPSRDERIYMGACFFTHLNAAPVGGESEVDGRFTVRAA